MFIKHLTGSRAGVIEDVIFESARAKILAGEAEDIYDQLQLKKPVTQVTAPEIASERADAIVMQVKRNAKRR